MGAQLQGIELCHHPKCRTAVRHKRGTITGNVKLVHIDERYTPIRLCLLCFLSYRRKYEADGWGMVEQEKLTEQ